MIQNQGATSLPVGTSEVMVDSSRRITLRNRQFLRKFLSVVADPTYKLNVYPEMTPLQQPTPAPQPTLA